MIEFNQKWCCRCKQIKSILEFYRNRQTPDGYKYQCIPCYKEDSKKYRKNAGPVYTEKIRKNNGRFRQNHREWCRFRHILNTYGLTLDQYCALEESQDFHCAICPFDGELHVDHNHDTNKTRGLLCMSCNMGLGNFKDSAKKMTDAIAYLATKGSYAKDMGSSGG